MQGIGVIKFTDCLRVIIDNDFCRYYKWLIEKHYYNTLKLQTPAHGCHITLYRPTIHGQINLNKVHNFVDKPLYFTYDPLTIRRGGHMKGFAGFYMSVYSESFQRIEQKLGINNGNNFLGYHITLANNKKL